MDRTAKPEAGPTQCGCVDQNRRRSVGLLLATGLTAVLPNRQGEAADPKPDRAPPQAGDEFVFAKGAKKGQTVTVADLADNGTLLEVWPKDPASDVVRSKSRLNRVLLLRLDPATLDPNTAKRAAEGIVAYSAFCTHAGCFIENYRPEEKVIFCHCHSSMFDPAASAKVTGGPAKTPLAGLPLKIADGKPVVAGAFQGKLGMPKTT
jgi:Rieske Fe-S protein